MKIDRLDAHDRLLEFQKEADLISQGCQDCINNVPDTVRMPFYVFMHARTVGLDEKASIINQHLAAGTPLSLDKVPEKRLIFIPLPRRPQAQPNSMLFRAQKGTDVVEIIWQIPTPELWDNYLKGNLFENKFICECIEAYKNNRKLLEDDPEPLTLEQVDEFRMLIKEAAQAKKQPYKVI